MSSRPATSAMAQGQRADSARRRQRVLKALNDAAATGEEISVSGLYKEVVPNEKLVFGWAWAAGSGHQSQVTVTTRAEGRGTLLTLKHEQLFDETAADAHRRGWNESLDKLAAHLAATQS